MDSDTRRIDPLHGANGGRGVFDDRGISQLIKDLRDEASRLFRQEVSLAKAELAEKGAEAGRNAVYLGAGAALGFAALLILLLGVTLLLTWGLISAGVDRYVSYWLAPLIVGAVLGGVAYFLVHKGMQAFRKLEGFVPQKTIESLQENAIWAKHKVTA